LSISELLSRPAEPTQKQSAESFVLIFVGGGVRRRRYTIVRVQPYVWYVFYLWRSKKKYKRFIFTNMEYCPEPDCSDRAAHEISG